MIAAVIAYFYIITYKSLQSDMWVTETISGTIDVNTSKFEAYKLILSQHKIDKMSPLWTRHKQIISIYSGIRPSKNKQIGRLICCDVHCLSCCNWRTSRIPKIGVGWMQRRTSTRDRHRCTSMLQPTWRWIQTKAREKLGRDIFDHKTRQSGEQRLPKQYRR